jgi:ParB family chromosome partitioning protein
VINKRKGLGRGLEALLGATAVDAPHDQDARLPSVLPLDQLVPGKYQPRTRMDEEALNELAESIRTQGLMQPILVRPLKAGGFEIIAGERRSKAARIAGLVEVPVLVRDVPDENAAVMALIENIQREDLNALEEAQGVQRLIDEFNMTHELAAKAIGRSRSATSNLLRLLQLAKPVQTLLLAGDLEMGHARALLSTDGATQVTLAHQVVAKRLSVRETETLVAKLGREFTLAPSAKPKTKSRDLTRLEEELSDAVASKVVIKPRGKSGGQVIIDFANYDQLDGLMARMKGSAASS